MNAVEGILVRLYKYGYHILVVSPTLHNIKSKCSRDILNQFTVFQIEDERSAAYFSIGFFEETEEKVILLTDSYRSVREFAPGITEASYRKFPIIVIMCDDRAEEKGNKYPEDFLKYYFNIYEKDKTHCAINKKTDDAVLLSNESGGTPVLINVFHPTCVLEKDSFDRRETITQLSSINAEADLLGEKTHLMSILNSLGTNVSIFIDSCLFQGILPYNLLDKTKAVINNRLYKSDGLLSECIGASFAKPLNKHYCFINVTSLIKDINVLGNRDVKDNIRVFIFNNNDCYTKSVARLFESWGYSVFGGDSKSLSTFVQKSLNETQSCVYIINQTSNK